MDLKSWIKKRSLQKKEEVLEIPKSLNDFFLSLDKETHILLKKYLSEKIEVNLEDLEKFIKNPLNLNTLLKNQPSNFHKLLVEEKYLKSAKNLCETLYYLSAFDLKKAFDDEDFNESIKQNTHPEGKNIVDHKQHMKDFPAHANYVNFIKHPEKQNSKYFDEGISPKLVHTHTVQYLSNKKTKKLSSPETYMAKPYHPVNDETDMTDFPLHGWATIATKSLFNAAGIGHLCEDVSVHEHENHPFTVHKFKNNADPIFERQYEIGEHNINPLHIHQIGVMDYLTNNLDRHLGNLLIYKEKGNTVPLAIDHERSFAYKDSLEDVDYDEPETPFGYLKSHGLNALSNISQNQISSHKPLVDWWKKNGMKIQKQLANQVSHIKDPAIRKHVYNNFISRWERMDEWANFIDKNYLYNDEFAHEHFNPALIKQFKQPINKEIFSSLPKNPRDAVSAVFDVANRKAMLSPREKKYLTNLFDGLIDKMSPKEMADVYKAGMSNPNWDHPGLTSINNMIFDHLVKPKEYNKNKKAYKLNHIKSIVDTIDESQGDHTVHKLIGKKLEKLMGKATRKAG